MVEGLKICVDSNEASSRRDVVNYLRLSGFEVDIRKLDVCDYVVSDRCGVERKDVSDFLGSMKDGRLFEQAKGMSEAYERPILILEGHMSRAFKRSRMRPASVYGALSSLALDYGLSIIPTENPDMTAVLLHRLAYREQAKEERPLQLRSVRRDMPPHQQQIFLLSGLPQVGSTLSEELLRAFDTPYRVLEEMASAEVRVSSSGKTKRLLGPLADVKGVGPVIVESAQRLLRGSYNALCELDDRDP
ncbi:MAG TPA: ERCC4 domain-containing protein [Patescibacteria group bacterium]|nr:ERCC4 domain-containing protein [Patescibacteria group bacterium]